MKASIFSYTRKGAEVSLLISACLNKNGYETVAYTMEKYVDLDYRLTINPGCSQTASVFRESRVLVYVGACGIAVRSIAPHVKSKMEDPAVIVVDELARHVIPLLSGHLGQANKIAKKIASEIEAQIVLTTATDINGLFAVDEWASYNGLQIASMHCAKEIAAALVDGEAVGFVSSYRMTGELPAGLSYDRNTRCGIVIGDTFDCKPFAVTLNLVPKKCCIGIGCRRGTTAEEIEEAVRIALCEARIDIAAVSCLSSVELKRDEAGLLDFAAKYDWPLIFFSVKELTVLSGIFTSSDFVYKTIGIDNVCERSAVACTENGRLLLSKRSHNGVTVAIARRDWQVDFNNYRDGEANV